MRCDIFRAAVSARLDGEPLGIAPALLDRHLLVCSSCSYFAASCAALHRRTRLAPADEARDMTSQVLSAIGALHEHDAHRHEDRVRVLRIVLTVVATVQLAMALPALVLGDDANLPAHAARHLGAFSVALAAGFLYAAWRPDRAAGVVPVAATLAGTLLLATILDLATGHTHALDEVGHAPEAAGLVAVWLLARARATAGPRRPVLA